MLVVSSCLAGVACRYNALSCPVQGAEDAILELVAKGKALPLCPEMLGGLAVPRPPCEICHDRVITATGGDCTAAMLAGVAEAMARTKAFGATVAILKTRSPSCGAGRIYDGTFTSRLIPGDGLWAAALRAAGLTIYTEESPETVEFICSRLR